MEVNKPILHAGTSRAISLDSHTLLHFVCWKGMALTSCGDKVRFCGAEGKK
jgi:hypothetical protein